MTKPKKPTKNRATNRAKVARKPASVLAWCALYDGKIKPGWCCQHRDIAKRWADRNRGGGLVRVRITVVPKGGEAMTIADFNEKFFEFARKHNIPVTTYSAPKRYGIIPCRRCVFFVPAKGERSGVGKCHRNSPPLGTEYAPFPTMSERSGCGDGLLREEAAPLPPEREQEPKP